MPEMTFRVRWPDGSETDCYSPSLVMHDHLLTGADYPLDEFVLRSTTALRAAGARVREKYGFACTSAIQQEEEIAAIAAGQEPGPVRVLRMHPPLPGQGPATEAPTTSAGRS